MDYKRLFYSAIGGWIIGLLLAVVVGWFGKDVPYWIELPVILGGAVGTYFFLQNNTKIENKIKNI